MKKSVAVLFSILLLVGCGAELSNQQLIDPWKPSTIQEWTIVSFYEGKQVENPDSSLKALQILLARKGVAAKVIHQDIDEKEGFREVLQVEAGHVIVVDHQGIRFKATSVSILEGMILEQL